MLFAADKHGAAEEQFLTDVIADLKQGRMCVCGLKRGGMTPAAAAGNIKVLRKGIMLTSVLGLEIDTPLDAGNTSGGTAS